MSRQNRNTREKILKATWALLDAHGDASARMSDIAKAAGISRQALYLHFPTRADLLIATARYLDEFYDVDARLAPSRTAKSGRERLDAFIDAWGNYIPKINGMAVALMAMRDDADAAAAWADRMQAVRHGCAAVVTALVADGVLSRDLTQAQATDLLWTLLSVQTWQHLCQDCGWAQDDYVAHMQRLARRALLGKDQH